MTEEGSSPPHAGQDPASPAGKHASLLALWTGLLLAPLAWFCQLSIETPLLSQACYPRDEPQGGDLPGLSNVVLTIDAAVLLIALAGGFIAWRAWRRTSREKPGTGQRLIASGDGRSRFMAMSGMLVSGLIGLAILYAGLSHLLLRECGL